MRKRGLTDKGNFILGLADDVDLDSIKMSTFKLTNAQRKTPEKHVSFKNN